MKTTYLLIALLFGLVLAINARASTYNFNFNNTEQGASSTASPSIAVDSADAEGDELSHPMDGSRGSEVAPISGPPLGSSYARWKISAGFARASSIKQDAERAWPEASNTVIGSLTYYLSQRSHAGLSYLFGRLTGPELEFNPFGVARSAGEWQLGFLLGFLKDLKRGYELKKGVVANLGPEWGFSVRNRRNGSNNFFLGAQTGMTLIPNVSLNISYRMPMLQDDVPGHTTSVLHASANLLF